MDASFAPEKNFQTSIDNTTITITISYEIIDLEEPNTNYRANGANYYYDNKGYNAFANLESIVLYVKKYCFFGDTMRPKIFNLLIPRYIVIFETTTIDKTLSLDLYIGKKKDL
jgi:hypothetical protein